MKKYFVIPALLTLASGLSCERYEFEEPGNCRSYFTAFGVFQPSFRVEKPRYTQGNFVYGQDDQVVFVEETASESRVVHHNLETGKNRVLLRRKDPVVSMAYADYGGIALTNEGQLYYAPAGAKQDQHLPLTEHVSTVKWYGNWMGCLTSQSHILLVDTVGAVAQTLSTGREILDWWAHDTVLVTVNFESVSVWKLPEMYELRSFPIKEYIEDIGNEGFVSSTLSSYSV